MIKPAGIFHESHWRGIVSDFPDRYRWPSMDPSKSNDRGVVSVDMDILNMARGG